ncbi:hypothetical protein ACELLULO517_16745 [Acidisoma cellulosilytica]|uniref:Uncharacterized protein n=1 Tax=Acidisoma cellulosilyticum TaxID=2802395 RepID=A0A964E4X0_9PROT|nr:hypothetical protein [Acidisoma cellulosilyticum]MCB8881894.1 hypothetical protein [Acidisoma cellulosilyticum]
MIQAGVLPDRPRPQGKIALSRRPAPADPAPSWKHLLPAGLLLLVSVLAILLLVAQPRPGQKEVAIVLPPWDGALQAAALVGRAGGALVDAGGLRNIFIVTSDRPDFVAALYRAGAWLVINPIAAHGCLSAPQPQGF